jgi:hypothetical protein
MASTKRTNVVADRKAKTVLVNQIEHLEKQLEQRLNQYKRQNNEEFPIKLERIDNETKDENYDYIRPAHYVQEDGRETWERMLDMWSKEEVALWCEMTVFKYQDRIGKKPNEDVKREQGKIDWYTNKAKELREEIETDKKTRW